MELATILSILPLVVLGVLFWITWVIRREVKHIKDSVDHLATGLAVLNDQVTIMLYLEIRDKPELLEKSPDSKQRALEAAERLGRKQLPGGDDGKR